MSKRPILIGITGGTGSGKSTVSKEICRRFDKELIVMIEQDSYYKDQSHLSIEERVKTNYDHPNAFDTELLVKHLKELSYWSKVEKPIYDFELHNRKNETEIVEPTEIIIVEGILVLEEKEIRDLLDIKIYVDTDADVRIIRRLVRDIKERGRSLDSVINQYLNVVRPMHMQFIEPSKRYADIIIPEGGHNKVAIDIIVGNIKQMVQKSE
ncbi:uridine kinase [Clostridium tetani]|uniref:Uridine kinase n=1 Tax=Clostridium tetani (strain Massachusetts / E88) TaxID=212717 RepID=URK_CLOTE|nr:uridine kinase [Clostridium tetani]Q896E3.1 RecName: Full=Uridine kinase; AltName: Full=Cytidine monophosphokinase; AltName: Full=Uridine monophosphokinase [Clostridium tetani E88]AAO35647.1 uridine kinase [Clostridium tetani E88]KGI36951.1 uridine kinase [Clostridium tetani]KGI40343.1 uridine kinase [Clostridium tetani ATCC 9441]KGI46370.1 uridine kinase [Clostridium tetani]KHO36477.1 uridine kinase [Clostridium tetani]